MIVKSEPSQFWFHIVIYSLSYFLVLRVCHSRTIRFIIYLFAYIYLYFVLISTILVKNIFMIGLCLVRFPANSEV